MFEIEMLPADHGDCLIIRYGPAARPHRILIDGGTPSTFKRLQRSIEALPPRQRRFELLIVTHIDSDHIGGILPLLREMPGVSFGDIWFNAWHHLTPRAQRFLGPQQGDLLGNLLSQRTKLPWNKAFKSDTVVVPDTGALPVIFNYASETTLPFKKKRVRRPVSGKQRGGGKRASQEPPFVYPASDEGGLLVKL